MCPVGCRVRSLGAVRSAQSNRRKEISAKGRRVTGVEKGILGPNTKAGEEESHWKGKGKGGGEVGA